MSDFELSITPSGDVINQLRDHIVILSMETQTAFAEIYGGFDWRADLSDPAVFWFESSPPTIFKPYFIGSTSGESNTWLWGWENINGFPDELVEISANAREIGEVLQASELTTAKLALGAEARAAAGLPERENADQDYVFAAMALSSIQVPVLYRGPTGEGSYAWFLIENDEAFSLPDPTPLATVNAVANAIKSGLVSDCRLALEKYAQRRDGVTLVETSVGVDLAMESGTVHLVLDELGRVREATVKASAS